MESFTVKLLTAVFLMVAMTALYFLFFAVPADVASCDRMASFARDKLPEFVPADVAERTKANDRDLCISMEVIRGQDKRLCNYIKSEQIKADCLAGRSSEPITEEFYTEETG